jgi:hypothetical protein
MKLLTADHNIQSTGPRYKTLILPVALYASETWPLTKNNEIALNTFERKILRKIYGPIQENGTWRKRYFQKKPKFPE